MVENTNEGRHNNSCSRLIDYCQIYLDQNKNVKSLRTNALFQINQQNQVQFDT